MSTGPSLPPPRPPSPAPPPPPSPWALPPGTHQPTPSPGLATAALVCGIVGIVTFYFFVPSVVALVLGLIAWKRARAAPGPGDARGRALAGWILGVVGVLGFAAIIITAVATGDYDDDDDGTVGVRELRAGLCIDVPDEEQVFEVPELDCDEPHDAEVYAVRELEGASYPGDEAVQQQALAVCAGDAFEEYFAVPFDESSLDATFLFPTEDNWGDGYRDVVCAAVNVNGRPLSRPMAGEGE
jgi:hypothetical protein